MGISIPDTVTVVNLFPTHPRILAASGSARSLSWIVGILHLMMSLSGRQVILWTVLYSNRPH